MKLLILTLSLIGSTVVAMDSTSPQVNSAYEAQKATQEQRARLAATTSATAAYVVAATPSLTYACITAPAMVIGTACPPVLVAVAAGSATYVAWKAGESLLSVYTRKAN